MIKRHLNLKKLIASIIIFSLAALSACSIPAIRELEFSMDGWSWAAFFSSYVVLLFIGGYLSGFLRGLLRLQENSALTLFAKGAGGWVLLSLAFAFSACLFPTQVAVSSVTAGILLAAIVCLAGGIDEVVAGWLDARNEKANNTA